MINGSDMLTFHCERLHFSLGILEYTDGDLLEYYNNYFFAEPETKCIEFTAPDRRVSWEEVGKQIQEQLEEFRAEFSATMGGRHLF